MGRRRVIRPTPAPLHVGLFPSLFFLFCESSKLWMTSLLCSIFYVSHVTHQHNALKYWTFLKKVTEIFWITVFIAFFPNPRPSYIFSLRKRHWTFKNGKGCVFPLHAFVFQFLAENDLISCFLIYHNVVVFSVSH